ncbi:MAG TPA: tyrosine-type recombinase/integrase, partial [Actinomycetota bacterium]|nr:tyrosine-type recombinase/integrase [Actinomycetota bacterium]
GMVTRTYVDPRAGKMTFQEYAEHWRSIQVHRASSAAHYETMLRRHTYPHLGDRALSEIAPSDIQAWVKRISEPLSASTVGVVHGIVSSCFKSAVRDRRIASNPCEGTQLPTVEPKQVVPLTVEQVAALHDAISDEYKALVHLCAASGLRQGEAFGLTADRVDFLRGVVKIDRQAVALAKQPIRFGPPKRPASYRDIPIPRDVIEVLSAHIAAHGLGDDGLLFHAEDGGFVRRSTFSAKVWKPARAAAGLPDDVGIHALRHFYASLLIRHGESVKTVQKRLGHANASETLDTYSHLWPDADERTREAVAGLFSGPVATDLRQTGASD